MADEQVNQETTQVEAPIAQDKMAEAMAIIDTGVDEISGEEVPIENVEQKQEKLPESIPEPETQQEDSKTQLWAKITQQDKEMRQLRAQMKNMATLDQIREVAHKDPARVLQELGIGIDQVIDALAQQSGQPAVKRDQEVKPELQEVQALKQELAQLRQSQQATINEQRMAAEVGRISSALAANPDRWEVINSQKSEGSVRLVLETAAELWKQTGEIPEYDVVMDAVEDHLASETRAKLEKLSAIKKFQKQQAQTQSQRPMVAPKKAIVANPNAPTGNPVALSNEDRLRKAAEILEMGDKEE